MTVREFCIRVGRRIGKTGEEVNECFDGICKEAFELIQDGDEVRFPGIGKIFCRVRPPMNFIDRFKLAQGVHVVRKLPERRMVKFTQESKIQDFQMKVYDSAIDVLNDRKGGEKCSR